MPNPSNNRVLFSLIPVKKLAFLSCFLLVLLVNCSCSNRTTPAPVITLYQGKDFRDFEKDTFEGSQYTVQKGDTLYSIAWYSGKDYREIANINNLTEPFSIFPGQQLRLKSVPLQADKKPAIRSGQTSRVKTNRTVDRPQKQAYGKSNKDVNKRNKQSNNESFPARIARWVWPAAGKLISTFSLSEQGSKGIEISGKKGNQVLAAADGKVVYTGNALRGYGQLVIIKHSESFLSAYAHNQAVFVKEQQWVKAGQKIASMGNTGTDKVKLRFEVRYRGKSVDPLKYLPSR
jgi:lipoprotein NlpD